MPVLINLEIESQYNQWEEMNIKVTNLYPRVKEKFNKHKHVIQYLEDSMMKP